MEHTTKQKRIMTDRHLTEATKGKALAETESNGRNAKKVTYIVIGISDSPKPFFAPDVLEIINKGKIFSGGKRHHEIVKGMLPADAVWINITVPIDNVFAEYDKQIASGAQMPIIIFASGDPLFYGFANTILRMRPDADIKLFPSFNSLQTLAHRIVIPYHDMRIVSLTGRVWHEFDRALIENSPKLGVLTDKERNPPAIAARMLEYGYDGYEMYVGEHLGNPEKEKVSRWDIVDLEGREFDYPNCLILIRKDNAKADRRLFGIPDDMFEILEGRPGMMTKMPIRILSLQAMDLWRRKVMWDVGFCTGSVSIEARLQFPHLQVVAFEIREEGERLMRENSRKFGVPGINAITGDFLEADISALPEPDAVFIGGHGGRLKEIIGKLNTVLQPGGCIVMNSVSLQSKELFEEGAQAVGMRLSTTERIALNEYNPIYIMKAIK